MMQQMAYRVRGEESKGVMRGGGAKWGVYITFERKDWLTVSPIINLRIGQNRTDWLESGRNRADRLGTPVSRLQPLARYLRSSTI